MKLSIAYITGRSEPRLDWVFRDLANQVKPDDELELIVVDVCDRKIVELAPALKDDAVAALPDRGVSSRSEIETVLCALTGCRDVRVVPPKPNIWQGAHRVTSRDWWAKSNASNTALCLARHDMIAFLDDRCELGPEWLSTIRAAVHPQSRFVIAGSYNKHETIAQQPPATGVAGTITDDHRRMKHPRGLRNCGGSWLYGCTFALPLAAALAVNGFEEGCDGLGAEDYIFGINLANAGYRIDFVPSLFVQQERSAEFCTPTYWKTDKGVSPNDKSHAALKRFGSRARTEFTPSLVAIRELLAEGGTWPVPDAKAEHRDWFDGQLISEMT